MMKIRTCLLTLFAVCASLSSATAASVESVSVHVASVEEAIPPLVEKRIAASIQTVGNHVFLAKDSDEIAGRSGEYERTVNDIINRVLIGYTVESIAITPGSRTELDVRIRPWGDTIRSVRFRVDYGALPAMGQELVRSDLAEADKLAQNLLTGLPVDALDWANGAVKSVLEDELEARVPEFYPHIVIHGGPETDVTVYMLPKLPVVRNVRVAVKGDDVPKVLFLSARRNLEKTYAGLDGLPVAFVQRHQRDIAASLQTDVQRQWVVSHYGLHVLPSLAIGEDTAIRIQPQTAFYDIRGGAYIDAGRKDDDDESTVLMAHLGRKIGSHHEVYGEVKFMPSSLDWNFIPGWFYRFTGGTETGYQFESLDDSQHLWLRQPLGGRWALRLDRDLTHDDSEVGLHYRVDDYVGLEYIVSDHDAWLRIIGYL
ncbi:hypothetical protein [Megasphaera sp.]|uniref:hypothetical protein n=1 Tax=Megasphaera sp. TaxID=2023260 RepID=UPI00352123C7